MFRCRDGPQPPDVLGDLGHHLGKARPLRGRHPGELHAPLLDAQVFQIALQQGEAPPREIVAGQIVAVARVAAGDQHAIGALAQRLHDKHGVHPPRAGHADDAHVGRVLDARRAGQVGARRRSTSCTERPGSWVPKRAFAVRSCLILHAGALLSVLRRHQRRDLGHDLHVVKAVQRDTPRAAGRRARATALAQRRVDLGAILEIAARDLFVDQLRSPCTGRS